MHSIIHTNLANRHLDKMANILHVIFANTFSDIICFAILGYFAKDARKYWNILHIYAYILFTIKWNSISHFQFPQKKWFFLWEYHIVSKSIEKHSVKFHIDGIKQTNDIGHKALTVCLLRNLHISLPMYCLRCVLGLYRLEHFSLHFANDILKSIKGIAIIAFWSKFHCIYSKGELYSSLVFGTLCLGVRHIHLLSWFSRL